MYPRIVELELWTPPLLATSPLDGKTVAERCREETGLPPEVVVGLNFVPDDLDVQNLQTGLDLGEYREDDFRDFCGNRMVEANTRDVRVAAEFLVFFEGQPLAWLHIPAEQPGLEIARALVRWAAVNGLQIRNGDRYKNLLTEAQVSELWESGDA